MEVKIIPVPGCVQIFLGVLTLGVSSFANWVIERQWPKFIDEYGLTTRSGIRIAWNEFYSIKKVITRVGRTNTRTEHFELSFPKGKVVVAPYRLVNGTQVLDYILQRLPHQFSQEQNL